MKSQSILLILMCLTVGCGKKYSTQKQDSEQISIPVEKTQPNNPPAYFRATGTEPFWLLEISSDLVVFTTPDDSIKVPHKEPVFAMDANVKMYRIKTEKNQINIQIEQKECANDMSGEVSPYTVSVELKLSANKSFERLEGCGRYITDYRLYDIWALESLNGKSVTKEDFHQEIPVIEINSYENTFMGFAGCNTVSGSLFFEKDLLRFMDVSTTEMLCEKTNKENEFLKALQSSINYSIENNRLKLSNPSKSLVVFRKVD
ncbi:MAG TPA: META domain-containing protein [Xanthomarina sp.]|nr:META domain-containing protein [Xanthomarina sp.]